MPRKPIIRSNEHFYHITARSNNRENFFLSQSVVWNIFESELSRLQEEFQVVIGAFVLMNNHFHLLIKTPNIDIDRVMYFLMKRTTLEIQEQSGRINKIFGGRYKGSLIREYSYLLNVYKYIYLNPVKAGISLLAENYSYSTLFYELNKKQKLKFKIDSHAILENVKDELVWINQGFSDLENGSIKHGMSKNVFEYKKERYSGRPIIVEVEIKRAGLTDPVNASFK